MVAADSTSWGLQILFLIFILSILGFLIQFNYFTMLFFYFNDWQFLNGFNISFILFSIFFSLLFGYPSNNFKNIITRTKIRIIVSHEVIWRYSIHRLLHSEKLMTAKKLLKCLQHPIYCSCNALYLLIN